MSSMRSLLFVGHPGHELRVFGWLGSARPLTCVLTDGSGRSGRSRLAATRQTLHETGAVPGPIFGAFTDAGLYAALLAGDTGPFVDLADRLAGLIVDQGLSLVAGDAAEGYNPSHDVCRLLLDAAVDRARRRGAEVTNFEISLIDRPEECPPQARGLALEIRLGDDELGAKLRAARREPDLAADVDEALARFGTDAFRVEVLRPVPEGREGDGLPDEPPFYERHGTRRVRDGKYHQVIRRRDHILPLAGALRSTEVVGRAR